MKHGLPLLLALALPLPAAAGTGPWTLGEGAWTLYGGAEYRRFTLVAGGDGGALGEGDPLPTGIRSLGLQAIGSYGLLDWAEAELTVPWVLAQADRADAEGCAALGQGACRTVESVALLQARMKLRLLDEYVGPAVSVAAGPVLRSGEFNHDERARLTTPTEGQTDLGAFVTVGRSTGLGERGWYAAWLQVDARHRFPNGDRPDGGKAPGEEVAAEAEVLVAPTGTVAFGPDVYFTWRDGVDLEEIDATDPDRFASLGVGSLRAGGKVLLQSSRLFTVVLSGTGTIWARNNPTDAFSVGLGLNYQGLAKEQP